MTGTLEMLLSEAQAQLMAQPLELPAKAWWSAKKHVDVIRSVLGRMGVPIVGGPVLGLHLLFFCADPGSALASAG
jgi:hypothetical protein